MSVDELRNVLREHRRELNEYGVKNIAIFGSVVRHEEKPDSDIDLLIDFDSKRGLFVFIDLKAYLEKLLGKKVDLVTRNALHPALKDKIIREAQDAF